jgi:hypothetical protein
MPSRNRIIASGGGFEKNIATQDVQSTLKEPPRFGT